MGTLPLGGLLRVDFLVNRLLPPRPFLDKLVRRVLAVWLFLRSATFGGSTLLDVPYPQSLLGSPTGVLFLIAVVIFVVWVEMRRKSEILFLANLGHSFRGIAGVAFCECMLLETGLRVAVAFA